MDAFKLLTNGARFDTNKFKRDFQIFKKANHETNGKDNEEKEINQNVQLNHFDINKFQDDNCISVDGVDVKSPIQSFQELNLSDTLRINLDKSNYHNPTPIQMQVIPLMLDNRQIIACAPTGSGKTLAFILPIIHQLKEPKSMGFRAIILAPTRELAKQIHRESLWISNNTGLRIHLIKNVDFAIKKFNLKSKLKYDILITTPQRLEYLLKGDSPSINIKSLEWLIVDECDRLFQATFLQQLAAIFNVCFKCSPKLKLALFSATYDQSLHEWCKINLNQVVTIAIGQINKVVNTIEQKLIFTNTETGKLFALKEIIEKGCNTPVLIFVNTLKKANYLQRELESMRISVQTIHSGRSQETRDKIVREFRSGKILFLICTELMGRGIDFKAVNLVINYDIPRSSISYIHNIGRTGRAGRSGTAITFYSLKDENLLSILNVMRKSGCDIPEHLEGLTRKKFLSSKNTKRKIGAKYIRTIKRKKLAKKSKTVAEDGNEEIKLNDQ